MTTKAPTVLTTTMVRSGCWGIFLALLSLKEGRCSLWLFAYLPRPAEPVTYHRTTIVHLHTSLNIHPDFRISVVKMTKKCKSHKKIIKDSCTSVALFFSSHSR